VAWQGAALQHSTNASACLQLLQPSRLSKYAAATVSSVRPTTPATGIGMRATGVTHCSRLLLPNLSVHPDGRHTPPACQMHQNITQITNVAFDIQCMARVPDHLPLPSRSRYPMSQSDASGRPTSDVQYLHKACFYTQLNLCDGYAQWASPAIARNASYRSECDPACTTS
jgi:hypothetical protein